jgi:hypothetical protein
MKLCTECEHLRYRHLTYEKMCGRNLSVIDGTPKDLCHTARNVDGSCGPQGVHWTPRVKADGQPAVKSSRWSLRRMFDFLFGG